MNPKPKKQGRNNPANVVSDFAKVKGMPYHEVLRSAGLCVRVHNPGLDKHEAYREKCEARRKEGISNLKRRLKEISVELTIRMKSTKYVPVDDLLAEAKKIRQRLEKLGDVNG